ncbi:MAG TPA: nucleotidyltransferase domain-containing protein [Lacibacter sp.]|nr:nucleotidyltransferase domain-containing protein [Lacibacter sp.]HMO89964.1 nucleotidyltransferase domain-containing protein [Lacibacter sp.]
MNPLDSHINDIRQLCSVHHVKHLFAFGSVLGNQLHADSDIDLVVDFDAMDPGSYTDNYFSLKFSLQQLLGRPVDLLEEKALRNPFFRSNLNRQKKLIYGY